MSLLPGWHVQLTLHICQFSQFHGTILEKLVPSGRSYTTDAIGHQKAAAESMILVRNGLTACHLELVRPSVSSIVGR